MRCFYIAGGGASVVGSGVAIGAELANVEDAVAANQLQRERERGSIVQTLSFSHYRRVASTLSSPQPLSLSRHPYQILRGQWVHWRRRRQWRRWAERYPTRSVPLLLGYNRNSLKRNRVLDTESAGLDGAGVDQQRLVQEDKSIGVGLPWAEGRLSERKDDPRVE